MEKNKRCPECGRFEGHHPWEPRFEIGEPKPAKWRVWRWWLLKDSLYEPTDEEREDRFW